MVKYRVFTDAYDRNGEWVGMVSLIVDAASESDAERQAEREAKSMHRTAYEFKGTYAKKIQEG